MATRQAEQNNGISLYLAKLNAISILVLIAQEKPAEHFSLVIS